VKLTDFSTFLGGGCSQTGAAFACWEALLQNRHFARIIDLGTCSGNFSIYLALWCQRRKSEFYTYDIIEWQQIRDSKHSEFDIYAEEFKAPLLDSFKRVDVQSVDMVKEIGALIQRTGCSVVFCDNGSKPEEVRLFAPFLKKDDIIAVHDWGSEISEVNIRGKGLQQIHTDITDEEGKLAFFIKQ
jgi:hypothetical protein